MLGSTSVYNVLFKDTVRVYGILSPALQWRFWKLFALMLSGALLEVTAISTLSLLGISIAAMDNFKKHPFYALLQEIFPSLDVPASNHAYVVLSISCIVLLVFIIKNIFSALVAIKTAGLGEDISVYISEKLMYRYLHCTYDVHISGYRTHLDTAMQSRESVAPLLTQMLNVYTYAITALILLFFLLSATPLAITSSIVVIGFIAWASYKLQKKNIDNAAKNIAGSLATQFKIQQDVVQGIREVLAYRQQKTFYKAFSHTIRHCMPSRITIAIAPPIPGWILECMGISIIPTTVAVLIWKNAADMVTIASVVSLVLLCAWRILPMISRSLSSFIAISGFRPMALMFLDALDLLEKQPSAPLAEPDPTFCFNQNITFADVGYEYPGSPSKVLHHVNFTLKKGMQYGFVGISGAGKSTLAALCSGLLTPSEGQILVDGIPLEGARLAAYMNTVGYVPQNPYILQGSVAENVAFSQWGLPYNPDDVLAACRHAAIDFVQKIEEVERPVGAGGAGLSGGQQQRLSIARALYAKPDILIFDEATSSLDQANEKAILNTISTLKGKMTVIMIAHRLATLEMCDYIYWVEVGSIKEHGKADIMLHKYKKQLDEKSSI